MGATNNAALEFREHGAEGREIVVSTGKPDGQFSRASIEQIQDTPIEPERVFLLRAAIRHEQVEREEMEVDEAFDALIDQFLHIVFPLPALDRLAEALWDNPGWRRAAIEHKSEFKLDPKHARFLRRVLEPDISFDRAYRAIQERRGGK